MSAREDILEAVKRGLKRGVDTKQAQQRVTDRLTNPPLNLIPARSELPSAKQIALFSEMATKVDVTIEWLNQRQEIPQAVSHYLISENLPQQLQSAPHPILTDLDWSAAPLLKIATGPARGDTVTSLSIAEAGIAESGTLMLFSGPETPTTLNFLPDHHLVLLLASTIVGSYEQGWQKLRQKFGSRLMPRTVNLITGPSRSADIEQTLRLGAHGPRRLRILLLQDTESPIQFN